MTCILLKGMMALASRRIYCDKTELVLVVVGKNRVSTVNLKYDEIVSIRFQRCKEVRFFWPVSSERIVITTRKSDKPFIYTKYREKKFFNEYKQGLAKFAKENNVTFYNEL